jgi:hypothetical protein
MLRDEKGIHLRLTLTYFPFWVFSFVHILIHLLVLNSEVGLHLLISTVSPGSIFLFLATEAPFSFCFSQDYAKVFFWENVCLEVGKRQGIEKYRNWWIKTGKWKRGRIKESREHRFIEGLLFEPLPEGYLVVLSGQLV